MRILTQVIRRMISPPWGFRLKGGLHLYVWPRGAVMCWPRQRRSSRVLQKRYLWEWDVPRNLWLIVSGSLGLSGLALALLQRLLCGR